MIHFLRKMQAMSKQVQALTQVVGKKEEQLQALRHHQTHMTTTIEQLQGEVKKNGAAAAADRAAKTYAADLQTKVCLCFQPLCFSFHCPTAHISFCALWADISHPLLHASILATHPLIENCCWTDL